MVIAVQTATISVRQIASRARRANVAAENLMSIQTGMTHLIAMTRAHKMVLRKHQACAAVVSLMPMQMEMELQTVRILAQQIVTKQHPANVGAASMTGIPMAMAPSIAETSARPIR